MGCVLGRACDPQAPDSSVRHTWHVEGVIVKEGETVQQRRGGLIYILNEAVCYRSRRMDCRKKGGEMKIYISGIHNTTRLKEYELNIDSSPSTKVEVVLLETRDSSGNRSVGLISKNSEKIYAELSDIISKHRRKPKIMQFNSIDIDGVEIEPI
uniref:SUI1 domain-containing protein n=1 Tax=Heterorhabditis bacteriophora TaxID=37862 RepID=A0A1I7XNI8_HETBA